MTVFLDASEASRESHSPNRADAADRASSGTTTLTCICGALYTTTEPVSRDAAFVCSERCRSRREFCRRLEEIGLLPLHGNEGEWFLLASELRIDAALTGELYEVVREGTWRGNSAPRNFVKREVRRRGREAGIVGEQFSTTTGKRFSVARQPAFAELATGDLPGEEVADYHYNRQLDEEGNLQPAAAVLTERERHDIELCYREAHAQLTARDLALLRTNPDFGQLLDVELMEVAVAISHGLTRVEFIRDGGWWLLTGESKAPPATEKERRQRAAAYRRLSDHKKNNPALRDELRDLARRPARLHRPESPSELRARKKRETESARRLQEWKAERDEAERNRTQGDHTIPKGWLSSKPTEVSDPPERRSSDDYLAGHRRGRVQRTRPELCGPSW
jgi:hypothetical protein